MVTTTTGKRRASLWFNHTDALFVPKPSNCRFSFQNSLLVSVSARNSTAYARVCICKKERGNEGDNRIATAPDDRAVSEDGRRAEAEGVY